MSAGWYGDPTGRFPARYFDGTDWTDQVQGGDGQVSVDAMERRSSGFAAPSPAPAAAWGAAATASPAWGSVAGRPATAEIERGPGLIGIALAGFGWLLVLVSFFGLDWAKGATRGDLADALPSSLPDGVEFVDQLWFSYVQWVGLALLVLVALGLVLTVVTWRGTDPTGPRLVVGLLAAVAAVLQTVTVVRGLGGGAEVGAQLGVAAYLLVIVGLSIGSRSPRLR